MIDNMLITRNNAVAKKKEEKGGETGLNMTDIWYEFLLFLNVHTYQLSFISFCPILLWVKGTAVIMYTQSQNTVAQKIFILLSIDNVADFCNRNINGKKDKFFLHCIRTIRA